MCDTVVATGAATADGITILGKNSDREPNEGHQLLAIPAADHAPDSLVDCTYIQIPQVAHTHAVLLGKPFWIWGAEMGVNEHGLAIGNEALFTRVPYEKGPALIGMDLLRLALERATTAQDAVQVLTDLLAAHGQGGNCGFAHKLFYHNGFVIADPHDAWVLETAGPHWAAKQVKTVYAMSNGITIGSEWDLASPDLVHYAIERGWCKGQDDFHFGRCYSDFLYTHFTDCRGRCRRTTSLLTEQTGRIDVPFIMAALRDHQVSEHERAPGAGLTGASVCMHAGFGPVRGAQTTGSLVAHLHPEQPTYFFTGTAAPCTSIFKPVWLDAGLPAHGPAPAGTYDEASLFWRHESLHRATLQEYEVRLGLYRPERDELEAAFVAEALTAAGSPPANRAELSAEAFATAAAAEARWLDQITAQPIQQQPGRLYQRAWRTFNREARFPG